MTELAINSRRVPLIVAWSSDSGNDFIDVRYLTDDTLGKVSTDFSSSSVDVTNVFVFGPDYRITLTGATGTESAADFAPARHKVASSLEQRLYATADLNHNVTSVDDVFGSPLERIVYDPYRNSTVLTAAYAATSDTLVWTPRSQGQREDATTNTIDSRNRVYELGVGPWLQADNIGGYVDGANRYQFVKSRPLSANDPTGRFSSETHEHITYAAVTKTQNFVQYKYYKQLLDANTSADFPLNPFIFFSTAAHAQGPDWTEKVRDKMKSIKELTDPSQVLWDMGRALHAFQDFFSHSDWIDGFNLVPYYELDKEPQEILDFALEDKPHSGTVNVENLSHDILDPGLNHIIYFEGGFFWHFEHLSAHERYAADERGRGRDALLEGSFERAKASAIQQSIEFIQWSRDNMKDCVFYKLYGILRHKNG